MVWHLLTVGAQSARPTADPHILVCYLTIAFIVSYVFTLGLVSECAYFDDLEFFAESVGHLCNIFAYFPPYSLETLYVLCLRRTERARIEVRVRNNHGRIVSPWTGGARSTRASF